MFGIGAWELTIIFAIILVLFGGKRLPIVASALGQSIRNFQTALKGSNDNYDEAKRLSSNDRNEG